MKLTICSKWLGLALLVLHGSACVTSSTHTAVVRDLDNTRVELRQTAAALSAARDAAIVQATTCEATLNDTLEQQRLLVARNIEAERVLRALVGEKDWLASERNRLERNEQLLAARVAQLERMRVAAAQRNAEYQALLSKLHELIDAKSLQVKVRNGRLVVAMESDVLFAPGSTRVRPAARRTLGELAAALAGFDDRHFQVIGHSDATPINTARFATNWELSTLRAVEVVKVLSEAGVPSGILTAAGAADNDPIVTELTEADRAMNRRVELVFVPNIAELANIDLLEPEVITESSTPPLPPLPPLPPSTVTTPASPSTEPAPQTSPVQTPARPGEQDRAGPLSHSPGSSDSHQG